MKKLTTGALLAALSLAGVSIAQAQPTTPFTPGDVLVGFTSSSSSGDLIIDLGNVAALLTAAHESVGGTIDLNAAGYTGFTAGGLSTQLGMNNLPGVSSVLWGAVAGKYTSANNNYFYGTVPTGSGAPTGAAAAAINTVGSSSGSGDATSTPTTSSWTVDPTQGNKDSWYEYIGPGANNGSFTRSWANPNGAGPGTEQFYYATAGGTLSDVGAFTLDSQGDLLFTSVPEPATYGLLAGLGLLAVSIRRQLVRS